MRRRRTEPERPPGEAVRLRNLSAQARDRAAKAEMRELALRRLRGAVAEPIEAGVPEPLEGVERTPPALVGGPPAARPAVPFPIEWGSSPDVVSNQDRFFS